MDQEKRERLEAKGYVFEDAADFLGLTQQERDEVDRRLALRRQTMDQEEQVLCVYRAVVERLRPWTGWTDFDQGLWNQVQSGVTLIKRSAELEADTTMLQIVVYGVVSYDDSDGDLRTLVYRRGNPGSESRLHGKLTLGVGGHVNRDDLILGKDTIIRSAMLRELKEELGLTPRNSGALDEIGILFDSQATGVNAVHIGHAFDVRVFESDIDSKKIEAACEPVGWLTEDEIRALYFDYPSQFEEWSRWVIAGTMMTAVERLANEEFV